MSANIFAGEFPRRAIAAAQRAFRRGFGVEDWRPIGVNVADPEPYAAGVISEPGSMPVGSAPIAAVVTTVRSLADELGLRIADETTMPTGCVRFLLADDAGHRHLVLDVRDFVFVGVRPTN